MTHAVSSPSTFMLVGDIAHDVYLVDCCCSGRNMRRFSARSRNVAATLQTAVLHHFWIYRSLVQCSSQVLVNTSPSDL